MNLPGAFEEKMKELLGEEFDEYIACYEEPRYYGLRVNTQKISVEEFQKICPFEIGWKGDGAGGEACGTRNAGRQRYQ